MKMLTCCNKVALATLIDCEGNISMFYQSRRDAVLYKSHLTASVANTSLDLLSHYRHLTGLGIIDSRGRPIKDRKFQYAWRFRVPELMEFLEAIEPHLIIKQKQCEIALKWLKREWETPFSSDDIYTQRDWVERMKHLNKTGSCID